MRVVRERKKKGAKGIEGELRGKVFIRVRMCQGQLLLDQCVILKVVVEGVTYTSRGKLFDHVPFSTFF